MTTRRLLAGVTTVLAVAAVLVNPSAALAAGTWSVQPIPAPPRPDGRSAAVSCPSATACMSVGYYVDQYSDPRTLAQQWDGSTWLPTKTPNRADSVDSRLTGVSCRSASLCLAVGYYTDRTGATGTLAEQWDGTSWHTTATPNHAGAEASRLTAVSCRSATLCLAVGYVAVQRGDPKTLAERWDGTSWHTLATPDPGGGAGSAKLTGVSCPTTIRCIAVGYYDPGRRTTLAEHWNGTTWTLISPPHRDVSMSLAAVSCASATACTAVGSFRSGRKVRSTGTLAETWDGATWVVRTTPDVGSSRSPQTLLSGISCSSPNRCTAVGSFSANTTSRMHPLAESWDGTTWTITPAAGGKANYSVGLMGVSCPAADACSAVGYASTPFDDRTESDTVTLAEVWDGTAWTKVTTPNRVGPQPSVVGSVSCVSASDCTAVGDSFSGPSGPSGPIGTDGFAGAAPLIERWDGTMWSVNRSPDVAGATRAELNGVSCTSPGACVAVGDTYAGDYDGPSTPLAEVWDGVRWQIVATPELSDATLTAVACSSATACTAVGYSGRNPYTLLVETWDGTSWTIATAPTPSGATSSSLLGVSCPSVSSCTASGYSFDDSDDNKPLVETWDGTSWSIAATPVPGNSYYSLLRAVSCVSAKSCTAVGSSGSSRGARSLIETWDGTRWLIARTPTQANDNGLSDVSCTSANSCTAVGYFTTSVYLDKPLAETWDGVTWTQDARADPGYLRGLDLTAVSCVSSARCTAVGNSSSGAPDDRPFAESTSH